jgi:biopolymer transport protein ExbB/TolQ
MKRMQRLLIIAVITLIITNLGLLGFIWKGHRLNQMHRGPMHEERMHQHLGRLGDRLRLEEGQRQSFRQAFRDHNQEMQSLDRKEEMLRRRIHEAAFQNNQQALDSLTNRARLLASQRIETYTNFSQNLSKDIDSTQREELIRILSRPPRNGQQPNRERDRGHR